MNIRRLLFILPLLGGGCCLPLGDGPGSEPPQIQPAGAGQEAIQPLPYPGSSPIIYRFPDGHALIFTKAGRKRGLYRLPMGSVKWDGPINLAVYVSFGAQSYGERLWVEAGVKGEFGWLDSSGHFHRTPLPDLADGQTSFHAVASHRDSRVTGWTRSKDDVFTLYHFDGDRWHTLPPPPDSWIEAGWGNPGGELVLLTYPEDPRHGSSYARLQLWRDGVWTTTQLPITVESHSLTIVPGPKRVLLHSHISVHSVNFDGSDFQDHHSFRRPRTLRHGSSSVAALPDGRFIFVGGNVSADHRTIIPGYDTWIIERSGKFVPGPPMSIRRIAPGVLVLDDDRIAVIGGWDGDQGYYTDVEILRLPPPSPEPSP